MKKLVHKNPRELSFTILETIVAVGLLMAFTLEMAGGQGNVINKVEYARRSNDAIWLAKRIMAQVEYNYQRFDLKELDTNTSFKDKKFEGIDSEATDFDYTYSVEIKEWKFPLFDFLLKGGPAQEGEDGEKPEEENPNNGAAGGIPGLDGILKEIFKGHIMKIAHVEVSWPDGARRDKVGLTYLLTNTKALDEYLATKKGVFDGVLKKMAGVAPQQGTPVDPPGSIPQADGSMLWPNGTLRKPDGTQILSDGTVIPPPPPQQAQPPQGGGQPPQGGAPPPGGITPPMSPPVQ